MLNNEWMSEYAVPALNDYADIMRGAGKKYITHMCGKLKGFAAFIKSVRSDGIDSVCPPTTGDTPLAAARVFFSDKVIIGGIEPSAMVLKTRAELMKGTIDALNELLGPPEEEYALSNKAVGVTRYVWLHGEMGVEAYEVEGAAYSVSITLPCGSAVNAQRALDALTREGNTRYGGMPSFDRARAQYYWLQNGFRFAFAKYNTTTVMSSCMKAP
jgi:hypothetical protein